jgi:ribonucleoside-diphosphate reductase alpha chain
MQATRKPDIGREEVSIPNWMRLQPNPDGVGSHCATKNWRGIEVKRHFTQEGINPFDTVEWEECTVNLPGDDGGTMLCAFPKHFSERARKIVAAKYLKQCDQEIDGKVVQSFGALVHRVVLQIVNWGNKYGYYYSEGDRSAHYDELCYLILHQYFAFNSPVWFNFGLPDTAQQGSACFIVPVEDSLDGLSEWDTVERRIFKRGSGSGASLSRVRSSYEKLALGGYSSGPMPFAKANDYGAGAIKSGGTTRRSAKMDVLSVHHPDILVQRDGSPGFIRCKAHHEKLARILIAGGISAEFNVPGNAYEIVGFQNANHSVRLTEEFMQAYEQDGKFATYYVTTGETCAEYSAKEVLREIAQATWECGDPGVQFDDLINAGNTCPNSFYIYASNPCSEYISRDDTSCNLASINVLKFLTGTPGDYGFNVEGYQHTTDMVLLAMEIIVAGGDFPTESIAFWTRVFRNLGLGHCNVGALLMKLGLAYDSDKGRGVAAMLASTLTARAYRQSAEIARTCGGPFAEFERNKQPMLKVLQRHYEHHFGNTEKSRDLFCLADYISYHLHDAATEDWTSAITLGGVHGFRNANVTVEAPTGTISFMMDADTTGIEPCIGLVTYKKLVGGGTMKMACQSVEDALKALNYAEIDQEAILDYIAEHGVAEGCPYLNPEHLPVFDCAFAPEAPAGRVPYRTIRWDGHMKMLGAIQPFISMSISKTVNMPETATVEDIEHAYYTAWEFGVKCVAIYRDNCKGSQPLSTKSEKKAAPEATYGPTGEIPLVVAVHEAISEKAKYGDLVTFEQYLLDGLPEHWAKHRQSPEPELIQMLREQVAALEARLGGLGQPVRRKLPDERQALTHKFEVAGQKGYVTVGLYPDGTPGELFIAMSKEGSTVAGLLDAFATSISFGLQYGVPLERYVDKFKHMRFEPSGFTKNQDIPMAKSILDYIFRWMHLRFSQAGQSNSPTAPAIVAEMHLDSTQYQAGIEKAASILSGMIDRETKKPSLMNSLVFNLPRGMTEEQSRDLMQEAWNRSVGNAMGITASGREQIQQATGPECLNCHAMTVPSGKCFTCPECGEGTGCS